ncbi:MAG: hypothetical protein PF487_09275, partial [Bacteroidales bacterium]|jgi:hypothetical protein|nr:hypothetical protein [Bacteroidales bacterium]
LYNDSIPLKEIFENTDICFAWTSSTNLEGVFFNCIAVQLNLGKFELSMQDFSKRINNYEELVLFISNLNKNEEFYNEILNLQREKAKDYFDNYSNVSKLIVKYLNKE